MRFAWSKAILAALVLFAASAAAQVNPHTQIRWPAGCASANMVYSQFINNCISALGTAANPAGSTKQVQYNLGGGFAASSLFTFDPSSGTLGIANVAGGIVNTVLDLKAKFGASGSQQTMTCTTIASTAALSSCTGGDFVSGQTVFIPAAGVSATISTPAAPTLACGSDNGGSCAGSVVYGYKALCVQGTPNGAMTTLSTAATITQGAQAAQSPLSAARPDVYTTVSGYTSASSSSCAIYKSINGSAYNFYFYTNQTTFNDFGGWSGHGTFSCSDIGFPCTAPSSATPNDVYATITANGAGAWTLSALTYPPLYATGHGIGSATSYPFTPGVSGTFVVQHDDTPAFAAAYNYMISNAGAYELHIPTGNYNLHNEDVYGRSGSVMHINNLNNFVLSGNGDTSRLYQSGDRTVGGFLEGVCGYGSSNPPGNCQTFGSAFGGGGTSYAIVDPVPVGSTSFTLSTPAQASNFPAGTYINLGNNGAGYPYEMFAEMNSVLSSNATTGVVNLAYPTTKPYTGNLPAPYSQCGLCSGVLSGTYTSGGSITGSATQTCTLTSFTGLTGTTATVALTGTNTIAGGTALTITNGGTGTITAPTSATLGSGTATCSGTATIATTMVSPIATPVSPQPVATHVKLRDFWYRGPNIFLNYNVIDYIEVNNITFIIASGQTQGFSRHQTCVNNRETEDFYGGFGEGGTELCGVAAATTDVDVKNNTYNGSSTLKGQLCSEGGTNITWSGNTLNLYGYNDNFVGPTSDLSGGGALCFNYTWDGTLNIRNGNVHAVVSTINALSGFVSLTGKVNIDTVGPGPSFNSSFLCVDQGTMTAGGAATSVNLKWNLGNNGICGSQVSSNAAQFPTQKEITLAGTSGQITAYNAYGGADIFDVGPLTGNITGVNLGSTRIGGYRFQVAVTQASAGGPYSFTGSCASSNWGTANNLVCANGVPSINPTAGSKTYWLFEDDFTNVTFIRQSYTPFTGTGATVLQNGATLTGIVSAQIGAGTAVTGNQGNGVLVQHSTGSVSTNNPAKFDANGNTINAAAADIAGIFTGCSGTLLLGADGACHAPLTKISNSITPGAATVSQCVEQTFTYTGLATSQGVWVTPPASISAHIWIGWARVSSANTLAIAFCADATGGTPPSGVYIANAN